MCGTCLRIKAFKIMTCASPFVLWCADVVDAVVVVVTVVFVDVGHGGGSQSSASLDELAVLKKSSTNSKYFAVSHISST